MTKFFWERDIRKVSVRALARLCEDRGIELLAISHQEVHSLSREQLFDISTSPAVRVSLCVPARTGNEALGKIVALEQAYREQIDEKFAVKILQSV